MTLRTGFSCAGVMACTLMLAFGQSGTIETTRLTPEELEWNVADSGIGRVDLAGNNETEGMYGYRVRFPEGFRNAPHFHPDDRIVTVISGTLHMAYGEVFDPNALKPLPHKGSSRFY